MTHFFVSSCIFQDRIMYEASVTWRLPGRRRRPSSCLSALITYYRNRDYPFIRYGIELLLRKITFIPHTNILYQYGDTS